MELFIRLAQQTGLVIGIMVCAAGGTIGAIGLAELAGRFRSGKKFCKRQETE